jgi:hypothetical protein
VIVATIQPVNVSSTLAAEARPERADSAIRDAKR